MQNNHGLTLSKKDNVGDVVKLDDNTLTNYHDGDQMLVHAVHALFGMGWCATEPSKDAYVR